MRKIQIHAPPDALVQFTVYDHPADHPNHVVVRAWFIRGGEVIPFGFVWPFKTLEEAREAIPVGMVCIPRFSGDDPCIAEVWT